MFAAPAFALPNEPHANQLYTYHLARTGSGVPPDGCPPAPSLHTYYLAPPPLPYSILPIRLQPAPNRNPSSSTPNPNPSSSAPNPNPSSSAPNPNPSSSAPNPNPARWRQITSGHTAAGAAQTPPLLPPTPAHRSLATLRLQTQAQHTHPRRARS
jgi:hypothetical protein